MAPKQRQIRIEQRVAPDVMEQLQTRTDEQLEAEREYKSVAYAVLGARAAERYDASTARAWFQKAMVASTHPQEKMQIRRMADASLALAERRAGDLKVAVEKLGAEAPSSRALLGLRVMGLIAPPRGASILVRVRGVLAAIGLVIALLALGAAIVELMSLFGGLSLPPAVLLGLLLDVAVLAVLVTFGRRRQKAARAKAAGGSA